MLSKCESCEKTIRRGDAYSLVHTPSGGPNGKVHAFRAKGQCHEAAKKAFSELPATTHSYTASQS